MRRVGRVRCPGAQGKTEDLDFVLEDDVQVSNRDRVAGWSDYPAGRRNETRQGGRVRA